MQTEAVQENSESNAQPETYIVPETERDLSRTAHKVIGEVFDTYIILEYDAQTLMFIDKHAAHERLLYEKLKRREEAAMAQTLLVPVTVTMDKNEYTAVLQNLSVFEQAGFDVEDFGSGTVLVRSAPLNLNGADIKDSVLEMAGYLEENKIDATTEHMDWLYHNIACRAAIKGGNASKKEELIALGGSGSEPRCALLPARQTDLRDAEKANAGKRIRQSLTVCSQTWAKVVLL